MQIVHFRSHCPDVEELANDFSLLCHMQTVYSLCKVAATHELMESFQVLSRLPHFFFHTHPNVDSIHFSLVYTVLHRDRAKAGFWGVCFKIEYKRLIYPIYATTHKPLF